MQQTFHPLDPLTLMLDKCYLTQVPIDVTVGQPLRNLNSKLIWINDPDDEASRIQIIVERRDAVVRPLEEHLNRNGGNFHLVADLGAPAPAQPAPVVRGGHCRSFD